MWIKATLVISEIGGVGKESEESEVLEKRNDEKNVWCVSAFICVKYWLFKANP